MLEVGSCGILYRGGSLGSHADSPRERLVSAHEKSGEGSWRLSCRTSLNQFTSRNCMKRNSRAAP
jgi:hypothetical protein